MSVAERDSVALRVRLGGDLARGKVARAALVLRDTADARPRAAAAAPAARADTHAVLVVGTGLTAAARWSTTAVRLAPLGDAPLWVLRDVVPLPSGVAPAAYLPTCAAARSPLHPGGSTPKDGIAFACVASVDTAAGPGLRLAVDGVSGVGEYEGTLPVFTPTAADTLALRVRVTDLPVWPLLVLSAGLLLALASRRYTGVRRAQWQLRRRALLLRPAFASAQGAFMAGLNRATSAAAGAPGAPAPHDDSKHTPSIAADFYAQADALVDRVQTAALPVLGSWDVSDPTYKALSDAAGMLEATLVDWGAFGHQLRSLRAAAKVASAAATRLPPLVTDPPRQAPQGVIDARAIGAPGNLTLEAFAARKKGVDAATAFLATLADEITRAVRTRDWIDQLRPAPGAAAGAAPALAATVDAQLRQVILDVWEARDAADLGVRATATTLLQLEHALAAATVPRGDRLALAAPSPAAKQLRFRTVAALDAAQHVAARRVLRAVPPSPAEVAARNRRTAQSLLAALGRTDWRYAALAWVVAVLGWLSKSYLGQSFGTLADYIGAFTWGFGASVGLDFLQTTLGKLGASTWGATAAPQASASAAVANAVTAVTAARTP